MSQLDPQQQEKAIPDMQDEMNRELADARLPSPILVGQVGQGPERPDEEQDIHHGSPLRPEAPQPLRPDNSLPAEQRPPVIQLPFQQRASTPYPPLMPPRGVPLQMPNHNQRDMQMRAPTPFPVMMPQGMVPQNMAHYPMRSQTLAPQVFYQNGFPFYQMPPGSARAQIPPPQIPGGRPTNQMPFGTMPGLHNQVEIRAEGPDLPLLFPGGISYYLSQNEGFPMRARTQTPSPQWFHPNGFPIRQMPPPQVRAQTTAPPMLAPGDVPWNISYPPMDWPPGVPGIGFPHAGVPGLVGPQEAQLFLEQQRQIQDRLAWYRNREAQNDQLRANGRASPRLVARPAGQIPQPPELDRPLLRQALLPDSPGDVPNPPNLGRVFPNLPIQTAPSPVANVFAPQLFPHSFLAPAPFLALGIVPAFDMTLLLQAAASSGALQNIQAGLAVGDGGTIKEGCELCAKIMEAAKKSTMIKTPASHEAPIQAPLIQNDEGEENGSETDEEPPVKKIKKE